MNHPTDLWYAEILGFTAPRGPHRAQSVVPLDAEECVVARFVTHKGHITPYEDSEATKLVLADADAMAIIAKQATRLAHEAFAAGVRWQQERVANVLGVSLTPEGD